MKLTIDLPDDVAANCWHLLIKEGNMKCCIIFEVAGPCRWVKVEHIGRYHRVLFLWFSMAWVPYKWTEFLDRLIYAVEHSHDQDICDACGKPIEDGQINVGHECNLHEWCVEGP